MEYYTIKEASQMLCVETHVLRYWEEELGLSIKRNDSSYFFLCLIFGKIVQNGELFIESNFESCTKSNTLAGVVSL